MSSIRKRSPTLMKSGSTLPRTASIPLIACFEEIQAAIQSLAKMLNQGHHRSDLTSRPLRFWLVHSYLIVYAPDEDPLLVLAVLHGRRSPRVMAAILRNRE